MNSTQHQHRKIKQKGTKRKEYLSLGSNLNKVSVLFLITTKLISNNVKLFRTFWITLDRNTSFLLLYLIGQLCDQELVKFY